MQLYQEILTSILAKEKIEITFPNLKTNPTEIIESESYQALQKIKAVIMDDSLSVSTLSTRSRRTNAIAAVKPCSAFFPRFPLFSENQLRKRFYRCLSLVFFQRVTAAAHVRLRDIILKKPKLILFRQPI